MTKANLVEKVAEVVGPEVTKRECGLMVDGFLDAVKDALAQGNGIELRGFGAFKVRHRKARTVRNPRTGTPVEVACRDAPVFEPSRQPPQPGGPGHGGCWEGSAVGGHPRAIASPSMPRCGPAVVPPSRRRFRWPEPPLCV